MTGLLQETILVKHDRVQHLILKLEITWKKLFKMTLLSKEKRENVYIHQCNCHVTYRKCKMFGFRRAFREETGRRPFISHWSFRAFAKPPNDMNTYSFLANIKYM